MSARLDLGTVDPRLASGTVRRDIDTTTFTVGFFVGWSDYQETVASAVTLTGPPSMSLARQHGMGARPEGNLCMEMTGLTL